MLKNTDWRRAKVRECVKIADDVRQVTFDVDGALPRFDPGSHTNIKVEINGEPAIRTYTCLPAPAGTLRIGVKLHPQSRGGSRFVWDLKPGDALHMSVPENRFPLSWRAGHYLLLAGGIGVTPIYGMAKILAERGLVPRMVYGGANRTVMPFIDELQALLGDQLSIYEADKEQMIDLDAEIAALPEDGELYICGPLGMLNAAKAAWARAGRPVSRFRCEVFGDNGKFAEHRFKVHVAQKDITVEVRPDQSMLDALMEAGVDMIYDCQRGECGLCAVGIVDLKGEVDHRDVFFSEAEKTENHRMCACVSRLASGEATIDVGYRA